MSEPNRQECAQAIRIGSGKTIDASIALRKMLNATPYVVGFIFLFYGSTKMFNLSQTIAAIKFVIIESTTSKVLAVLVTAIDMYVGLLLLFKARKRNAVLSAICCLCVYSCFLAYLASMKHPPGCGCGGALKLFESDRANAGVGLFRNAGLLAMLLLYYKLTFARKDCAVIPAA